MAAEINARARPPRWLPKSNARSPRWLPKSNAPAHAAMAAEIKRRGTRGDGCRNQTPRHTRRWLPKSKHTAHAAMVAEIKIKTPPARAAMVAEIKRPLPAARRDRLRRDNAATLL